MKIVSYKILPLLIITAFTILSGAESQAQDTRERVVAKSDVTVKGKVIAKAGDLLLIDSADGQDVVLVAPDGQRAKLNRQHVASMTDAAPVLTALISEHPEEERLYVTRANIHAMSGDLAKAIQDTTKAIELNEDENAANYISRGLFYMSMNDPRKAAADFVKATKINNKAYAAYTHLAAAHIVGQQYDKAIEVCDSVIKADDDDPAHYIQRGVANRFLKNWDAAIADFTKALSLSKDNVAAISSRGFVYYLKGDHANAVKDFDAIVRLQPEDPMAYNNRGFNRQLTGDFESALADFEKAISLKSDYAMALQNKAWLLATCPADHLRDGEAAIAAAAKACELRNHSVAADIKTLAAAYAEAGNFDRAIAEQQKVVQMATAEGKAVEETFVALYQQKKPYRTMPPVPAPVPDEGLQSQASSK